MRMCRKGVEQVLTDRGILGDASTLGIRSMMGEVTMGRIIAGSLGAKANAVSFELSTVGVLDGGSVGELCYAG